MRCQIKYRWLLIVFSIIILLITGQTLVLAGQQTSDPVIYVDKIVTDTSEILTVEQIRSVVKEYEGKYLNMDSLNQLVADINNLYSQTGSFIAKAFLLSQEIEDGLVKIKLVESKLGEIYVKNNEFTVDNYILERLSIKKNDLIKLDDLQNDLFFFNSTNEVQIKVEIESGSEYGTSDIIINTTEPSRTTITLFADNAGRKETGIFRQGFSYTDNSLFGLRNKFSLSLVKTNGSLGKSFSYNLPVNKYGTRLGLSYNENDSKIISGEFETIGIESKFNNYSLGLTHPIIIDSGLKRFGLLEVNSKELRNIFSGAELQASDVSSIMLGLQSTRIKKNLNIFSKHAITHGNVTAKNSQEQENQFLKYTGNFLWQKLLPNNYELKTNLQMQYTKDKLISSSDQFTLGGKNSIRGYPEGILMGDSGYSLRTTLSYPRQDKIMEFIYFDFGQVYPYKGNNEPFNEEDYLSSFGYGGNISFNENINTSITLGFPFNTYEYGYYKLDFLLQLTY